MRLSQPSTGLTDLLKPSRVLWMLTELDATKKLTLVCYVSLLHSLGVSCVLAVIGSLWYAGKECNLLRNAPKAHSHWWNIQ